MKKYLLLLFAFGLVITSCKKNDDDIIIDENQEVSLNNEVNDFVWSAMNSWYLWQDEVLELGDERFANQNDYYTFLNKFDTPRGLFQSLESPKDRFSAIVDDYDILFNAFSGVAKTNGIEFVLTRPPSGGNDVVIVVRYIISGSSAEAAGIKRGDIIYAINGTPLFAEADTEGRITSSNLDLYNEDVLTLNFAEITDGELIPNDVNIEVTKTQLTENPILISKTLDVQGTKVGYIMYNSFTFGFDEKLNDAFGNLKSEGATELVLDLRYNLGGSGTSAQRLCSMITGQFTGQVVNRDIWNSKWNSVFGSEDRFVNTIEGIPLNSLNLEKVYIIATDDSASASEYVLNSLAPYIEVIHIGDVTVGKNQLSVTLVDTPDQTGAAFGDPSQELPYIVLGGADGATIKNANTNHKYALQPIVGISENAEGFSEFTDGLVPDIVLLETLGNLGELGNIEEPLLARAIQEITGITSKSLQQEAPDNLKIRTITSSSRLKPNSGVLLKDNLVIK